MGKELEFEHKPPRVLHQCELPYHGKVRLAWFEDDNCIQITTDFGVVEIYPGEVIDERTLQPFKMDEEVVTGG